MRQSTPSIERPKRRSDCQGGERPCPWISCKYHLIWEMREVRDTTRSKFWNDDAWVRFLEEMEYTCVLDFVDDYPDGAKNARIGDLFGIERERIRQLIYDHGQQKGILMYFKGSPEIRRLLGDFECEMIASTNSSWHLGRLSDSTTQDK